MYLHLPPHTFQIQVFIYLFTQSAQKNHQLRFASNIRVWCEQQLKKWRVCCVFHHRMRILFWSVNLTCAIYWSAFRISHHRYWSRGSSASFHLSAHHDVRGSYGILACGRAANHQSNSLVSLEISRTDIRLLQPGIPTPYCFAGRMSFNIQRLWYCPHREPE